MKLELARAMLYNADLLLLDEVRSLSWDSRTLLMIRLFSQLTT